MLLETCGSVSADANLASLVVRLLTELDQLRAEVARLRRENLELRQQAGYWQSRHADAVRRIAALEQENERLRGENRKLQAERFGRRSEKQSRSDRSNDLEDPADCNPSRSHRVPEDHYPSKADGVLMVDRYSAYKAMQQVKNGTLILAFCWAHVRRDFVRVGKGWPELKPWALDWLRRIRDLYRCNRQRLATPTAPAPQAALQQAVISMRQQLDTELADPKLRTPACKALTSLQEHWAGLTLFVDDSRIPMDNNLSERRLRGPALGRKNYYGSGALWSGNLAARLFSLFATLNLWQINPRLWLHWYLQSCAEAGGRAPNDIEPFMPWNISPPMRDKMQMDTPTSKPDSS